MSTLSSRGSLRYGVKLPLYKGICVLIDFHDRYPEFHQVLRRFLSLQIFYFSFSFVACLFSVQFVHCLLPLLNHFFDRFFFVVLMDSVVYLRSHLSSLDFFYLHPEYKFTLSETSARFWLGLPSFAAD